MTLSQWTPLAVQPRDQEHILGRLSLLICFLSRGESCLPLSAMPSPTAPSAPPAGQAPPFGMWPRAPFPAALRMKAKWFNTLTLGWVLCRSLGHGQPGPFHLCDQVLPTPTRAATFSNRSLLPVPQTERRAPPARSQCHTARDIPGSSEGKGLPLRVPCKLHSSHNSPSVSIEKLNLFP